MTAPTASAKPKIALDQRALSRHDSAGSVCPGQSKGAAFADTEAMLHLDEICRRVAIGKHAGRRAHDAQSENTLRSHSGRVRLWRARPWLLTLGDFDTLKV
jgi:hypothetical protein